MKRSPGQKSSPGQSKKQRKNSPTQRRVVRNEEPNRRLMAAQAELERQQALVEQEEMDAINRGGKSRRNNKAGKNKSRRRRTNKNK